jgi:hypothetical protein
MLFVQRQTILKKEEAIDVISLLRNVSIKHSEIIFPFVIFFILYYEMVTVMYNKILENIILKDIA